MRFPLSLIVACLAACGPAASTEVKPTPVATAATQAPPSDGPAAAPRCQVKARRLSALGHSAVRPQLATGGDGFAVVWEDATDRHRGVLLQPFDRQGAPLGPAVEVADLTRGGAEPRVAADGDGFIVLWTVDEADSSTINLRRVDARGRPRGDVIPIVSAAGARALAAARVSGGFVVAWWTWSASPPTQSLTFLDERGQPTGKPLLLTRGTLIEADVDFRALDGSLRGAWVAPVEGVDHAYTARVTPGGVGERLDLGPGNRPSVVPGGTVWAVPAEATVWWSPEDAAKPSKLTDGQAPAASGDALCLFRTAHSEERTVDELYCGALGGGRVTGLERFAVAPGGVLTLSIAQPAGMTAVAYQTEEGEEMAVVLLAAECGKTTSG